MSTVLYQAVSQFIHPALAISILFAMIGVGLYLSLNRRVLRIVEEETPITAGWEELGAAEDPRQQ